MSFLFGSRVKSSTKSETPVIPADIDYINWSAELMKGIDGERIQAGKLAFIKQHCFLEPSERIMNCFRCGPVLVLKVDEFSENGEHCTTLLGDLSNAIIAYVAISRTDTYSIAVTMIDSRLLDPVEEGAVIHRVLQAFIDDHCKTEIKTDDWVRPRCGTHFCEELGAGEMSSFSSFRSGHVLVYVSSPARVLKVTDSTAILLGTSSTTGKLTRFTALRWLLCDHIVK